MKRENLLPINLQFFAEEAPTTGEGSAASQEATNTEANDNAPENTVDDKTLNEQLQTALVEIARLKRAVDKNASEASEYKKKYRDRRNARDPEHRRPSGPCR